MAIPTVDRVKVRVTRVSSQVVVTFRFDLFLPSCLSLCCLCVLSFMTISSYTRGEGEDDGTGLTLCSCPLVNLAQRKVHAMSFRTRRQKTGLGKDTLTSCTGHVATRFV